MATADDVCVSFELGLEGPVGDAHDFDAVRVGLLVDHFVFVVDLAVGLAAGARSPPQDQELGEDDGLDFFFAVEQDSAGVGAAVAGEHFVW